jgi:hypothetical protein
MNGQTNFETAATSCGVTSNNHEQTPAMTTLAPVKKTKIEPGYSPKPAPRRVRSLTATTPTTSPSPAPDPVTETPRPEPDAE